MLKSIFLLQMLQTFSSFTIGAPVILDQDCSNKQENNSGHSLPRKKRYDFLLRGISDCKNLLTGCDPSFYSDVRSPGLSSHIPNYFSLPIALSSLKSSANEQQTGNPYIYGLVIECLFQTSIEFF